MIDPAISMSYDPTGPRNGKWSIRRPDYGWNSYETLPELIERNGSDAIWPRYHWLNTQYGRELKPNEEAELVRLRAWLVMAGVVVESNIF